MFVSRLYEKVHKILLEKSKHLVFKSIKIQIYSNIKELFALSILVPRWAKSVVCLASNSKNVFLRCAPALTQALIEPSWKCSVASCRGLVLKPCHTVQFSQQLVSQCRVRFLKTVFTCYCSCFFSTRVAANLIIIKSVSILPVGLYKWKMIPAHPIQTNIFKNISKTF